MRKRSRAGALPVLLVMAACVLAFFWRLGSYGLFDLDEGLYVEAAREMNLTGDFVTPRVNGIEFFEKPPLVYWQSALSQRVLGKTEFAARLPAAGASAILAVLVLLFGSRFFGAQAGLLAGLSYALAPLVFGAGRQLTMDAVLSLWITAALFAFFQGYTSSDKRAGSWLSLFWACCGFGTLAKGAPGIVIPLAVVAVFLMFAEGAAAGFRRLFTGTRMLIGIPLFLLIVVPWHVAAWQANGSAFVDEYVIRQHLGRFRGGDTAHRAPFWFYVPVFFLLFFPWSFFTIPALFERGARKDGVSRNPTELAKLLCRVWFALVFIMFSVSGSKLISYILPLFAPAALLGADWAVRAAAMKERRTAMLWALGLATILAVSLFMGTLLHEQIISQVESATRRPVPRDQLPPAMITFVTALAGTAAATCACAWLLALFRRGSESNLALAGGMSAFFGVAVGLGLPAVDSAYMAPLHDVSAKAGIRAGAERRQLVILTPGRRPSALFYLPDPLLPESAVAPSNVVEITQLRSYFALLPVSPYFVICRLAEAQEFRRSVAVQVVAKRGNWVALKVSR